MEIDEYTHIELLLQSIIEIVGAAVYGVMQRSERNSGSVQDS